MTWRTGRLRNSSFRHRRLRIIRRDNAMLSVTVCAYRTICFPSSNQLAVDTFPKILLDAFVTLSAGIRNIEVIDRRLLVSRGQYFMCRASRRVAVISSSGDINTTLCGFAVNTGFVDFDRVIDQDFVFLCDIQVFVANATCLREVSRMCSR